ncbi:MAG: hypothetical protein ACR2IP_07020 [Solirubrobacteraceae bacterium]
MAASSASALTASFTSNQLQLTDDRFTDDVVLTYFATPGTPATGPGQPAVPERHFANINDAVGVEPSTGCIFATPPMTGVTCEVPVNPFTAKIDLGPGYDRFYSNLQYNPAGVSGRSLVLPVRLLLRRAGIRHHQRPAARLRDLLIS